MKKVCVSGEGGYTLQSSLILCSRLYSNVKFTLDWRCFQIKIKRNDFFFQYGQPHLADPPPSPLSPHLSAFGWPLLPPSRCGHPLWKPPAVYISFFAFIKIMVKFFLRKIGSRDKYYTLIYHLLQITIFI